MDVRVGIKKAECQRIGVFELWCWKRLLRVPWTARSNQFILKEISPEYSLKGLTLKLKLQYFGHLMWNTWLTGKHPDAGKDWRQEEKGTTEDEMVGWHYWLDGHEFERAPGVGEGQGSLACCSLWGRKESDTTEWLNWLILVPPLVGCVTLGKIPNCSGLFFNLCNHDSNVMYLIGWWTGRPGVLHSMGSQRVGHDWVNELNWTGLRFKQNGVYKALSTLSDFYSKISQSMHIYGLN